MSGSGVEFALGAGPPGLLVWSQPRPSAYGPGMLKRQPPPPATSSRPPTPQTVEYHVHPIRETLIGDKIDTDALQATLNAAAGDGWALRTSVRAPVKGRVGPGGVDALILILERPV